MTSGKKSILFLLPVLGSAFVLSFFMVTTPDVFWHLKTGELIVTEGRNLTTNRFSSTWPDHPWPNPEWLFQVILYLVHAAAGWKGLTIFKVAISFLLSAALYGAMILRGGGAVLSAALTILSLAALQFRFTLRPHLFSYLFTVVTLLIVERHRRRGGRMVFALPLLFALWSNIHPELIIALLCLGAVIAGDLWARRRGGLSPGSPRRDRSLSLAVALSIPATLLNPETWHVIAFPFTHLHLGPVIEVSEYASSTFTAAPLFWLFLLFATVLLLRFRRDADPGDIIMIAGAALLGAFYIRGTPYLFLVGGPVAAGLLGKRLSAAAGVFRRRAGLAASLIAALALTWALGFDRLMPYRWGWGLDETDFPAAAADLLATGRYPANLYHGYGWGGYLLYRLYPAVGVFQDGRAKAYPPEYLARLNSRWERSDWLKLLREYEVNSALVERIEAHQRFSRREWGVVYWDERWVLLVRRAGVNRNLLEELEYRRFLPEVPLDLGSDRRALGEILTEMQRSQSERRERSPETDNNIGVVLRRLGKGREAEEALLQAAEAGYAPAWANLGQFYLGRGESRKSREAFARAAVLDPALAHPETRNRPAPAGGPP